MIWAIPFWLARFVLWALLPARLWDRIRDRDGWCSVGVHDHNWHGWCRRCGHDEFGGRKR